jgi:tRNA(Ile)-lysidine synthase
MGPPVSPALPEEDFLERLRSAVSRHADAYSRAPRINIAFSGGLDSALALRAFVELAFGARLRALHIDHGLHADSRQWTEHCRRQAEALGVAFESRRVEVDRSTGFGVEAAAREARYAALRALLGSGEIIVTAHHADDQLETVLLRLLRGTGARGLAGIVELAPFGAGLLHRPLLGFSRAQIRAQARRWSLDWLEDPSNRDLGHDRNYLREQVLPRLESRWPSAASAAVRLARHMGEAQENLAELARIDLGDPDPFAPVPRETLRQLSPARQRNALRWLIEGRGFAVPSTKQLEELRESLNVVRPDARTTVTWPGAEVRVYRDKLYFIVSDEAGVPSSGRLALDQDWEGGKYGRLTLVASERGGLPEHWARDGIEIRFRAGGERFKPLHDAHSKSLKQWLREAAILPWMRDKIPLLYRDGQLIAVADLCLDDDLRKHQADAALWRVEWRGHPPIR